MPNKIYTKQETSIRFAPTGNNPTVLFNNIKGLSNGSGAISLPYDFGVSARPSLFELKVYTKVDSATSPTDGASVEFYISTSDNHGDYYDGALPSGEALFGSSYSTTKRNLKWIGSAQAQGTSSGQTIVSSTIFKNTSRFMSIFAWNSLGAKLSNTASDTFITVTPIPDEIQ